MSSPKNLYRIPRLFISHSSQDQDLVFAIVQMLQAGLSLSDDDIRCTSIDGYRLPGGVNTEEQLRVEVYKADAFVGVVSQSSLSSLYVAFELGARWGANRHLLPLLAPGIQPNALSGPLAGKNALSCDSAAQLHQLVRDLAYVLGVFPQKANAYQVFLDQILVFTRPQSSSSKDVTAVSLSGDTLLDDISDAKRRVIYDEAFSLWKELKAASSETMGDSNAKVVERCRGWWERNSLYMDVEISKAFRTSFLSTSFHPQMLREKFSADAIYSNWKDILRAGDLILAKINALQN